MHSPRSLAVAALVFSVAAAACGAGTEPVQSAKTVQLTGTTTFPPDLGRGAPRYETEVTLMYMPTEIQTVCAGMDPKFEYDSRSLESTDNKSLRVLAECMKTGPLAGKTLKLIGHADIRGSARYDDNLGKKRAESVKLYLMKSGIPSERLITETVGKSEASPLPEDWDRRVDFEVVQ